MGVETFTRCEPAKASIRARDEGPFDFLQEALKLLRDPYHIWTFILIHTMIVLPATFLLMLKQWFEYEVIHKFLLQPSTSPGPWPEAWIAFLVYLAFSLGYLILSVNVVSSVWFAAGSMYSGKNVSFKDVMNALPNLWKKLGTTALLGNVFYLILFFIAFLTLNAIRTCASALVVPVYVLFSFTLFGVLVGIFFINTLLQLAYGATVFDDNVSGWKAFYAAWKLAKTQWCNALGLLVLSDIPGFVLGTGFIFSMLSTLDPVSKAVIAGLSLLFNSLFRNLSAVTYVLFYFHTKTYHNEEIKFDALPEITQFETGYQSISDGSPA